MLSTLLERLTPAVFFRDFFQQAPYAEPSAAAPAVPLLTWQKVVDLIAARPRPDMIVSRRGAFLSGCDPASADEARALFGSGCSIVLRNVEQFDRELDAMADGFRSAMAGDVNVHSFATPLRHVGFGWHYDCEDVFILQTSGTKEYLLRRNTVNPEPRLGAMPRDMQFERETSPMIASTLVAGDWLYIPRGWWHMARAVDDALSISVGVLSPAAGGRPAA
jgi:50S ribosomal protein L16 3-hydroxylase